MHGLRRPTPSKQVIDLTRKLAEDYDSIPLPEVSRAVQEAAAATTGPDGKWAGTREGIPAIVLFGPLLFPIARQVGVHEVHYAMVIILAMGVGLFAPPFGVGYYAACAISRVHPDEGLKPIVGYMIALLIGLLLVAFVPWISIGFL